MIGYTLILLLLGLILWILISPIRITIDSQNHVYSIDWFGIGKIGIQNFPDDLVLRSRLFFWKKDIHPLQMGGKKKVTKAAHKKEHNKASHFSRRKGIRLLRSFQMKEMQIDLDTDSVIYNSYLFPVFYFLSKGNRRFHINYQGHLKILVMAENRLYRIIAVLLF